VAEDVLQASVAAGESGPVITLSGEADLTTAARMSTLICRQLTAGTVELTIDVSGLSFADTASIRALVLAARTLKERGGRLVLLDPQPPVARMLALLGADQMLTIHAGVPGEPGQTPAHKQGAVQCTSEEARP
jgi:anti-sigma B factor antagonist